MYAVCIRHRMVVIFSYYAHWVGHSSGKGVRAVVHRDGDVGSNLLRSRNSIAISAPDIGVYEPCP